MDYLDDPLVPQSPVPIFLSHQKGASQPATGITQQALDLLPRLGFKNCTFRAQLEKFPVRREKPGIPSRAATPKEIRGNGR
jgi:hypothetical protein